MRIERFDGDYLVLLHVGQHVLMVHDECVLLFLKDPAIIVVRQKCGVISGSCADQQDHSYGVADILSFLILCLDGVVVERHKLSGINRLCLHR